MIRKCQKNNIQAKKKETSSICYWKAATEKYEQKNMNKKKNPKKELCSLGFDKK